MRIPDTGLASTHLQTRFVSSSHRSDSDFSHERTEHRGQMHDRLRKGKWPLGVCSLTATTSAVLPTSPCCCFCPQCWFGDCCVTQRKGEEGGSYGEMGSEAGGDPNHIVRASCDAAPRTTSGHSPPSLEDNPSLILTGILGHSGYSVHSLPLPQGGSALQCDLCPEPSPNG